MIRQKTSYLHFFRVSIFLLLVGLCLDSTFSYAFVDLAHVDFELVEPFDTGGEKEGESEDEKEDREDEKIDVNIFDSGSDFYPASINTLLSLRLALSPHPDIKTPPPK